MVSLLLKFPYKTNSIDSIKIYYCYTIMWLQNLGISSLLGIDVFKDFLTVLPFKTLCTTGGF